MLETASNDERTTTAIVDKTNGAKIRAATAKTTQSSMKPNDKDSSKESKSKENKENTRVIIQTHKKEENYKSGGVVQMLPY